VPAEEAPGLRRRWLAAHPYAEGYAAFTDFALWRFLPERAQFVGGFAAAHRLSLESLRPPPEAAEAIAAAEAALLAGLSPAQAEAIALAAGARPGEWRVVAIDTDGCDVATPELSIRVAFATAVDGPEPAQAALAALSAHRER
jgi:putative heme iron utilization protein